MKMFDEQRADAAALVSALFREFHTVPQYEPSRAISPSGMNCPVACVWKLQGIMTDPEKESFQSRGFAENGEDRHRRIQEFLSQTQYWVDVEQYVAERGLDLQVVRHDGFEVLLYSPRYKCRFKCDGMLKIDGVYYILEIKTERQASNNGRTAPDDKHQMQGKTYTLLTGTSRILWVYEGRDYLEQKVFVQTVSADEKQEVADYIDAVLQNVDTPELLERNARACTYCAYKKHCKAYFKEIERKEKLKNG